MLYHQIHLDPIGFSSRPEEKIWLINRRLVENPTFITILELKETTGKEGKTFCPGFHKGERKKEYWKGSSIGALDFDNKIEGTDQRVENQITPDDVLTRLEEYGLSANFIYFTFSHAEEWNRFRVVFQFNQCIIDADKHRHIMDCLLTIFPEADTRPTSVSSFFYGGKDFISIDDEYQFDIDRLIEVERFISTKKSGKNIKRDLSRKYKVTDRLGFGRKYNTHYINNNSNEPFSSALTSKKNPKGKRDIDSIRGVNFNELSKEIKILADFMNPNIKLKHPQLLGLATNLIYIEGGQKLFRQSIDKNPDYNHDEKHKIMKYCKAEKYPPFYLDTFSPHKEDHKYGNLLKAAQKKSIIRLDPYQGISIDESRTKLDSLFKGII